MIKGKFNINIITVSLFLMIFFLFLMEVFALKEREEKNDIEEKEFSIPELYISDANVLIEDVINNLKNRDAWREFLAAHKGGYVYFDVASGKPSSIIYSIPLIPSSSNNITLAFLSSYLGYEVKEINEGIIKEVVVKFIRDNRRLLDIEEKEIGEVRVGNPTDYLWQVYITREIRGIKVRGASLTMTINHGNLVLWGLNKWADIRIDLHPEITKEEAIEIGFKYIGSRVDNDEIKSVHLEVVPVSRSGWDGSFGKGYEHRLVWSFIFRRAGYRNNWEILVDAHNGEIISFQDLNLYITKKIIGAVYPITGDECCPDGCAVKNTPIPFTDTGFFEPNDYTNLGGLYDYSGGTLFNTLSGKYIDVQDNCGTINESSTDGDLNLGGESGEHDCAAAAGHSAGDTFASRMAEVELSIINRIARGWVNYNWLDTPQIVNTNLAADCIAYTGPGIYFYRSGTNCRNTGEITAILDHEWGHFLDDNDTNGLISNPAEAYADIIANLRLHQSCVGRGFYWNYNRGCGQWVCPTNPASYGYYCDGYGDCCTSCTGVRDSDYNSHSSKTPHRPDNFICVKCATGSGPCARKVQCESDIPAEAVWDLAARDFQSVPFNYDKQTAFEIATKLFYISSGNITNWYSCSCPNSSNGCGAANGFMQFLATDDDNGDISDGTPHMTAIYAAFNRHGIACDNPPPVNSGCSGGPTTAPTLTATGGNYNVSLSWNSVPGASQYYVLRTEGIKACDFGKIKLATVSATNYTDTQTLNGRRYYYQVMPVGSDTACIGPLSNCVTAIPSSASPPGKITNSLTLSKSGNNIILNWQSTGVCVINAYAVYRGSLPINLYNHSALNCSVTTNSYTDISATGSHYYLVVPNNSAAEGSYGKSFNGSSWQEIPQAETPCKDEQNINDC